MNNFICPNGEFSQSEIEKITSVMQSTTLESVEFGWGLPLLAFGIADGSSDTSLIFAQNVYSELQDNKLAKKFLSACYLEKFQGEYYFAVKGVYEDFITPIQFDTEALDLPAEFSTIENKFALFTTLADLGISSVEEPRKTKLRGVGNDVIYPFAINVVDYEQYREYTHRIFCALSAHGNEILRVLWESGFSFEDSDEEQPRMVTDLIHY